MKLSSTCYCSLKLCEGPRSPRLGSADVCQYTILDPLIPSHGTWGLAVRLLQEVGGISIIDTILIEQEIENRRKSISQIFQQMVVTQGLSRNCSRMLIQLYLEHTVISDQDRWGSMNKWSKRHVKQTFSQN